MGILESASKGFGNGIRDASKKIMDRLNNKFGFLGKRSDRQTKKTKKKQKKNT